MLRSSRGWWKSKCKRFPSWRTANWSMSISHKLVRWTVFVRSNVALVDWYTISSVGKSIAEGNGKIRSIFIRFHVIKCISCDIWKASTHSSSKWKWEIMEWSGFALRTECYGIICDGKLHLKLIGTCVAIAIAKNTDKNEHSVRKTRQSLAIRTIRIHCWPMRILMSHARKTVSRWMKPEKLVFLRRHIRSFPHTHAHTP